MNSAADLFDTFRHTACRYEGLPAYTVDEEIESIRAWREHRPREERSVRTDDWLRRIAVTTAQGKRWSRVRAVDHPLPDYLRWELTGYVENQAAGEETLLVDRVQAFRGQDFWLFDAGTPTMAGALMHYDQKGAFHRLELVEDPDVLAELDRARRAMLTSAVPLNVWLTSIEGARVA